MAIPVEPSAEIRQGALTVRALYVAYIEAGFTSAEALTLVAASLGSKR